MSQQTELEIFDKRAFSQERAPKGATQSRATTNHACWLSQALWGIWLSTTLFAAEPGDDAQQRTRENAGAGWYTQYEAAFNHQLNTDTEAGGDVGVNRFASRASFGYRSDYANSVSLSVGYGLDAYDFSGPSTFPAVEPWDEVHTVSIGLAIRRKMGDRWGLLAIPTVRAMTESNGDFDDSISGGAITGLSYQVNPRLSIGPGFGALTQLEDSVSYFPIIIVNWQINDRWKIETGRGLGATQGPGLLASYSWDPSWAILAGARFERLRFRLNKDGATPNGIGEDRAFPVYLGARYLWPKIGSLTFFGGVTLAGKLQLDDPNGNELITQEYDSAPFVGLSAQFRF